MFRLDVDAKELKILKESLKVYIEESRDLVDVFRACGGNFKMFIKSHKAGKELLKKITTQEKGESNGVS